MKSKILNSEEEEIDFNVIDSCNVRQLINHDKESLVDYISIIRDEMKSIRTSADQMKLNHDHTQAKYLETINMLNMEVANLRQQNEKTLKDFAGLKNIVENNIRKGVYKAKPGPTVMDMLNIKVQQEFYISDNNTSVDLFANNAYKSNGDSIFLCLTRSEADVLICDGLYLTELSHFTAEHIEGELMEDNLQETFKCMGDIFKSKVWERLTVENLTVAKRCELVDGLMQELIQQIALSVPSSLKHVFAAFENKLCTTVNYSNHHKDSQLTDRLTFSTLVLCLVRVVHAMVSSDFDLTDMKQSKMLQRVVDLNSKI